MAPDGTGLGTTLRDLFSRRLPPDRPAWPPLVGLLVILFLSQVVSGSLLSLYYQASEEMATESVRHVMRDVRWGWLIRGIHHWSAQGMLVLALLQIGSVFVAAGWRRRGTGWLTWLLVFGLVALFTCTGEALPWDTDAYWVTDAALDRLESLPLLGPALAGALRGGQETGGATLSRAYSAHALVLPWLLTFVLLLHFALAARRRRAGGV
ncbi:MAG: hypothetical protein EYC70_02295 [Planctomycetota bacterium]|nr:MAG: hypothetical protein EYC70_02295 [Planctomycetota bacterium]